MNEKNQVLKNKESIVIFWFRRDLRIDDNAGLYFALRSGYRVLPLYIFDPGILERLEDHKDRRIEFITGALGDLQEHFIRAGSSLAIYNARPPDAFSKLLNEFNVRAVYANHDYEPYAVRRDPAVGELLKESGIPFHTFKDQVIFEKDEVLKSDGTPYTVFTPYLKAWKKLLIRDTVAPYPSQELLSNLVNIKPLLIPSESELGFMKTGYTYSAPEIDIDVIRNYHLTRNIPSLAGTSRMGPHLRFGTVSIRKLVITALSLNDEWLNELIWREFFMAILWHFPHVAELSFKQKYESIIWRNNEEEFGMWCNGLTGFPIVDAGMRELNETGFMHNRVRMITAGFLVKDLLIDWRWGEAYFAAKLLDFELSSNNGNWQWAAGCGCDAAPYFRVFSPAEQTRKFDPDLSYIRKWIPETDPTSYPKAIVDHSLARERALKTYREALQKNN